MKRRYFLLILLSVAAFTLSGQYSLPKLSYDYNALEPFFDEPTMKIHYNNHHGAYVKNLNAALVKYPELAEKSLEELLGSLNEIPENIRVTVRNNGGGHYNHTLFWTLLAPPETTKISPRLERILKENFGSIEVFKTEFEKAALSRFGSGWVWLIVEEGSGKLKIVTTPNQDSPVMSGFENKGKPVLALDLWEHAYYLKYQYKRADYVKAFWNVVNWNEVERLLNA